MNNVVDIKMSRPRSNGKQRIELTFGKIVGTKNVSREITLMRDDDPQWAEHLYNKGLSLIDEYIKDEKQHDAALQLFTKYEDAYDVIDDVIRNLCNGDVDEVYWILDNYDFIQDNLELISEILSETDPDTEDPLWMVFEDNYLDDIICDLDADSASKIYDLIYG